MEATNFMKTTEELDQLKYRSFRGLFPVGVLIIIAVITIELSQNSLSSYDLIMLPIFALIITGCWVALWRNASLLRNVEFVVIISLIVYFLGQFYTIIISRYIGSGQHSFNTFPQWIPIFYLLIFFVYSSKQALIGSIIFYSTLLIPGMIIILLGISIDDRFSLIHIFLSNGIYISLIYSIMRLKENYLKANATSEIMSKLATTDYLTGIVNRRHLTTLLDTYIPLSKRYGRPFSIIIFDLDHFKQINDVKGHHSGDDVLKTVADTVQKNIRLTDHLGRWGGDEFLVIVPETNLENTLVMAEKLRKSIEENRKNDAPSITASFGVASCSPTDTPESLVSRADGGLLKAKRNGKNRVEVG